MRPDDDREEPGERERPNEPDDRAGRERPDDSGPPTEEQFAIENLLGDLDGELSSSGRESSSEAGSGSGRRPINQPEPEPAQEPEADSGTEGGEADADSGASQDAAAESAEGTSTEDAEAGSAEEPEPAGAAADAPPDRTAVIPPLVPGQANRPPITGDFENPPRRKRIFLSFFVAALLIIGSVAGASSATVIIYLGDIASDLRENSLEVGNAVVPTSTGEPQTILLLGSDSRSGDAAEGRPPLSDTAMLLRLDPDNDQIALMSIPRDLKVKIPGHGTDKFNAAYAYGGPRLTLKTVRRLTGGLDINHIVNIDFVGFIRAIDELNCIFVNVDRRYYNSNEGVPPELQYAEIDIEPGYQKLCGEDALDYARYRHTDNDLVRSARQQQVMRAARQRIPVTKLISDRKRLIDIFTDYTTSDIDQTSQMIELINLLVDARNATIQQVQFPGVAQPVVEGQPAYVVADPGAVRAAVERFMGFEASSGPRGSAEREDRQGGRRGKRNRGRDQGQQRETLKPVNADNDGLVDASQGSRDVAETTASELGPALPVFYPTRLPAGTIYAEEPRVYHLRDTDKNPHGAYAVVLQLQPQGDYFLLQGIRGWSDPPILSAPHDEIEMRGKEFKVYFDGDRIRMIAWHHGDNSYWISNSLVLTMTNDQMLGMARSLAVVVPDRRTREERLAITQSR